MSNRLSSVTIAAATERAFITDNAGNITSDTRSGTAYTYAYNKRNRLNTVTVAGSLKGTYTYNALEQLTIRVSTNQTPAGTTHFIHDIFGNVIAETAGGGATGATGTVREYIYLPETEIAPTFASRTVVDRPLAVVNAVNTAAPVTWYVHTDHLNRPIKMTDAAKASVWTAVWAPWGAPHSITGTQTLNSRFPGQWFQMEAGLHYNWHRSYDPSLGRYTQGDPLEFIDGPSVYAYATSNPIDGIDLDGLRRPAPRPPSQTLYYPTPSGAGGSPSSTMPPIRDPEEPGGGDCACRCRSGNPGDINSFRFAERRARTCGQAARDACKDATAYCTTAGGNVHHVSAKCSDGTTRSGAGKIHGRWKK